MTLAPPALVAAVLCGLGAPVLAEGGNVLDFNIGARLSSDSNPDLTPISSGPSTTGGLTLSFGLTNEAALSTLSLQGSAGLLTSDDSGTTGLTDPNLTLSYARTTANAALTLDGTLGQSAVAGGAVDNFQTGDGLRRSADLSGALTLGTGGPLGFGLTAGYSAVSYHDTPNAGLPSATLLDSQTLQLGADLRADLSQVLHANFGVQNSRFTQDGAAARDTLTLTTGLTLDRPAGPLALRLDRSDTTDGPRSSLTFEQTIALPGGTLSYSLGTTRAVSGSVHANGSLSYATDLAQGGLSLDLSQAIQPGAETDTEVQLSSASFSYTRPVTPRAGLTLALNWAEQRDTATDLASANTSLSATWTQSVTPDWALDLGYTRRLRDQDGVGLGQSDQVFVELRRAFSLRF